MIAVFLYSEQTPIFDIQHTTSAGIDGTFPSEMRNQKVELSGIVFAKDYLNGGFFVSHPEGGKWSGLLINDRGNSVNLGDQVTIQGEVHEQFGLTTIRSVKSCKVISRNNPLPSPTLITTAELAYNECYEGVLVQLSNVTVVSEDSRKGVVLIDDGTGICRLANSFLKNSDDTLPFKQGDAFSTIIGVVDYRYGEFRINPRGASDIKKIYVGVTKPSWGRIKSLYR